MSYCIYAKDDCECSDDALKGSANESCLVVQRRLEEVKDARKPETKTK